MKRTVLIVAGDDDLHAQAVAAAIERKGGRSVFWGAADFPSRGRVAFDPAKGELEVEGVLGATEAHSVWWRRPGPIKVAPEVCDARVRQYCFTESLYFLRAVFDALPIPVINHPWKEEAARKPRQLAVAAKLGLTIPHTWIGTDPAGVKAFWDQHHGRCVYKPLTPPSFRMAETRALTAEHLADLHALRHAPILIQEHVPLGVDVRITIIGDRLFAAEVTRNRSEAHIDWRLDLTATWSRHSLPALVQAQLHGLLGALGLEYGSIDMRQRPDGEYVFFEVNPAGQFLFLEIDAELPLADAMACLLLR